MARNLYQRLPSGRTKLSLHPGQTRAWNSQARFVFMLAGSQGGKTSFGPWWLWREIEKNGDGDYLAVTSTFDLFKLKMLPEMLNIFESHLRIGRYWAGDKIIELKDPVKDRFWAARATDRMWGRIILRSASAKGGLESATAKAAWLDEAGQDEFSQDAYEAVLRRLSLHEGRVLGTTTIYNLGWVKQQVYDPWVAGDSDYDVIQFSSVLNPVYSKREYERAERTLPSWKFKMFYKGEFSHPPGLIYDCYDDDLLKVKPFPIPPHWPRYVGLDPGGTNLALIWLAEDPVRKVFFAYRESLEGRMTTAEHVAKNLERAAGENVVMWAGGAPSEGQTRRDWTSAGIFVREPSVSEVWAGIDRVTALFKTKRLFVFENLVGLRDELGKYSRKLNKKTLEPEDEIKDKNTFHRLDALRYIATRLDTATFGDIDTQAAQTSNPWNVGQTDDSNAPSWWSNR